MNAKTPKTSDRRLWLVGCVTAVVAIPILLYKQPADFPQRRRQIEELSAVERARLDDNFNTFLAMSEPERESYRQLHRSIEEDAKNGGRLRDVMHNYRDWLKTLSVWQQVELRQAGDAVERFRLVRRIKEEQAENPGDSRRWGWPFSRRRDELKPALRSEDLASIMTVVEEQTPITPERRREWEPLPPIVRYLHVLDVALERAEEGRFPGQTLWPDEPLTEKLRNAISNEAVREAVQAKSADGNDRAFLAGLIAQALITQWRAEQDRREPTDEQIRQFFVELKPEQQDEIMRNSPEGQEWRLHRLFMEQRHADFWESRRLLWHVISQLMPRPDRPPRFEDGRRPGRMRPPFDAPDRGRPRNGPRPDARVRDRHPDPKPD